MNVVLMKLHSLYLANNTFETQINLNPSILERIQVLDLSRNLMTQLEPFSSPVLKTLRVARNNISAVWDCAFCNTSIQHLDLGFNRIAELNKKMFKEVRVPEFLCFTQRFHLCVFLFRISNLSRASPFPATGSPWNPWRQPCTGFQRSKISILTTRES